MRHDSGFADVALIHNETNVVSVADVHRRSATRAIPQELVTETGVEMFSAALFLHPI